jgi:hypothetical protein
MTPTSNGWNEYQRLVLAELKRLDASVHHLHEDLDDLRLLVEVLRTRAITWGAVGGLVVWLSSLVIGAGWVT